LGRGLSVLFELSNQWGELRNDIWVRRLGYKTPTLLAGLFQFSVDLTRRLSDCPACDDARSEIDPANNANFFIFLTLKDDC
jgi:hypothetical protein